MKRFPFVVGLLALLANLILGGGTHPGFLADAVLQFLCIFVCAYAIWRLRGQQLSRAHWVALTFIMLAILLPALALIPLPPSIIENLPQWEVKAAVFQLIGRPAPWSPVSVSPEATWLSLMSLIPALAVFLTSLQFDLNERRQASLIILGFGIVSVFLGLVQLAQGPASPLRLFPFTNIADAVGFFANRNHLSALLYVTLLVAAAWAVQAVDAVHALPAGRKLASFQILWLIAALTAIVLVLAAQAMTRSRAGLGLTIIALLGAYLLAAYRRTTQARLSPARLLMGAVGLAVVVSTQFALYGLMERLADDPLKDARIPFARNTFESAKSFMCWEPDLAASFLSTGCLKNPRTR